MSLGKSGVLFLWLLMIGASAQSDSPLALVGQAAFVITLMAHVVEFFVFRPLLRSAPGSLSHHFLQMLIFGVFHEREVRARLGDFRLEVARGPRIPAFRQLG